MLNQMFFAVFAINALVVSLFALGYAIRLYKLVKKGQDDVFVTLVYQEEFDQKTSSVKLEPPISRCAFSWEEIQKRLVWGFPEGIPDNITKAMSDKTQTYRFNNVVQGRSDEIIFHCAKSQVDHLLFEP